MNIRDGQAAFCCSAGYVYNPYLDGAFLHCGHPFWFWGALKRPFEAVTPEITSEPVSGAAAECERSGRNAAMNTQMHLIIADPPGETLTLHPLRFGYIGSCPGALLPGISPRTSILVPGNMLEKHFSPDYPPRIRMDPVPGDSLIQRNPIFRKFNHVPIVLNQRHCPYEAVSHIGFQHVSGYVEVISLELVFICIRCSKDKHDRVV